MIKPNQLALYASAATLALVAAAPAQAGGTTSGTTITNNVTVDYQVDGVTQSATGASSSFKVDRKIALTLIETNTATSQVAPGQTSAVTTFTLTNNSNATLDFGLAVVQPSGGAGAHSNTDNFDATNVRTFVDSTPTEPTTRGPIWPPAMSMNSAPMPRPRCLSWSTSRQAGFPPMSRS